MTLESGHSGDSKSSEPASIEIEVSDVDYVISKAQSQSDIKLGASAPGVASDATSVIDLGEDLLEKTAVLPLSKYSTAEPPAPSLEVLAKELSPRVESKAHSTLQFSDESRRLSAPGDLESSREPSAAAPDLDEKILHQGSSESDLESRSSRQDSHSERELLRLWQQLAAEFHLDDEEFGIPRFTVHSIEDSHIASLSSESPRSDIDLGIAFLEMGAYADSVSAFERAIRTHPESQRAAVALLAQAKLKFGKAYEALHDIQAVVASESSVNGSSADEQEKYLNLELCYWAGRCSEELQRLGDALTWFRYVLDQEPEHRDVQQRLERLIREVSGGGR